MRVLIAVGLMACACLADSRAEAGLLGQSVTVTGTYGSAFFGPATAVVDGTVEFPGGGAFSGGIQVTDTQVRYIASIPAMYSGGGFNGFEIDVPDSVVSSVTIDAATTITPFSVRFTDHAIFLDLESAVASAGAQTILDINATGVPAPVGGVLAAAALLTTVLVGRRRG